jgi:hypothetical protein
MIMFVLKIGQPHFEKLKINGAVNVRCSFKFQIFKSQTWRSFLKASVIKTTAIKKSKISWVNRVNKWIK